MLLEYIAMAAAAIGTAGIFIALRRLTGQRLPKWIVPASAGAAMIAFAVWSEYSWFGRAQANMPEGLEIVTTRSGGAPWRPWSYAIPVTTAFVAIDRGGMVPHAARPDEKFFNAYWFERWGETKVATLAVDCLGRRGAELPAGADFPVNADLPEGVWATLPEGDPILRAACGGA